MEAFYSARAYAPLWIDDGAESRRAKAAASYLAGVDADGLDPADYTGSVVSPTTIRRRWRRPNSS